MKALVSSLALVALALVAACDSADEPRTPTQDELIGLWKNDDAGTTRAFEFVAGVSAAESPALAARPYVYTLYFHPTGGPPAIAQRGFYTIEDGHLVTEVVEAPLDPSQVGRRFANIIEGFTPSALTLESTSSASGTRVFAKVDTL